MNPYFNPSQIPKMIWRVLPALPVTVELVAFSLLFGLLIGLLIALMALSKSQALRAAAKGYVAFMRGIPTLVLIFILYLVLPIYSKWIGIDLASASKNSFIIATLSLSSAANLSEMMRSAYLAVDKGQREAAYSVGMDRFDTFRRIVFPQAFGVAIPTLGNCIIGIFKSTSLAFSIGAVDLMGRAKLISANSYGVNEPELYIGIALIFWVVCVLLERVTKFAERHYSKGKRSVA